MDKALELFSTQGYDAVSVGEIAKAVGIKAPSLYNHFSGKRAIFDAIMESTAAQDMLVGAMGMKIVPAEYFGVVERFSVFAATGFNAALGIHLFCRKPKEIKE